MAVNKWIWAPMKRGRNPKSGRKSGLLESPSSSTGSSSARGWKYDVFLSFRGLDTRKGITSELHKRLQKPRGIKTFMDDHDLEVGNAISPTLLTAIDESRFAIVVLSPNYGSSTWCLEELVKICQCMDENRILPLFFNVDPTDVRFQKNSFEDAFTRHKNSGRHKSDDMQRWRDALTKVANLSGWNTQNYKTDSELADAIVEFVCSKVQTAAFQLTGDFEAFEATTKAIDKVMKAIKNDKVTAIGIHGMGGVGKTTLVEHVGQEAQNQGLFIHVVKVVVTQNPDLKKIQNRLADWLGIKLKEETEVGRADRLKDEIMKRNKILIILDDIWERIELSDIGVPTYNTLQKCNSKVLLTTRRQNVCLVMKCQEKIHLNILSEQDSWTLFVRNAGGSFESTNFDDVARRVARECCGLPVALIAVARALGDKDMVEWEKAVGRLKKSQPANSDDQGDVSKCIRLSYDYLRDEDSKSLFLLCCLFPEDYDIKLEDLFRYAFGKGLFPNADTIQEAREQADSVAKDLKHSSLLLHGEVNGCVRMHDVIRDTAVRIASREGLRFLVKAGCGEKIWPRLSHEDYSAISLMGNEIRKLPEHLVCPKLQILLLQENDNLNEITEFFFQSSNELRVLDLSSTSVTSLPQSLSLLTSLQALHLDYCQKIIDFSILRKLKKLEVLSMRGYPLRELSREVGHLINLKMLDVSDEGNGCIVTIPSKVISKLHRLQELYMRCGFWDWGSRVVGEVGQTNIGFGEITGLPYLKILKVCISNANCIPRYVQEDPNWDNFEICISRDRSSRNIVREVSNQVSQYSRYLVLDTNIDTLPDWFIRAVTSKTEKLQYVKSRGLNDVLVEYHRGRLHNLKHLSVIGSDETFEALMHMDARTRTRGKPVFENLEELHLESVKTLTQLCFGKLPDGSLRNLKVLKVRCCPNLGTILLPSELIQRLPNLEKLICKYVPRMKYVFGLQGFEPEHSKLREITFFNLIGARRMCDGPAPPVMFETLRSLFIYRCNFVGGLFSSDAAQHLFQLEELYLGSCPCLERVIEASDGTASNKRIVLPKLKYLVLEKLPRLYMSGSATIDFECPSLVHLYVNDCPEFSASTPDFHSRDQVHLNDKLHYFGLLTSRMFQDYEPTLNNRTSLSKTMEKKLCEMAKSKLPELVEKLPELMEKMPEMMENMPDMLEKMPEFMERISVMMENMPEFFTEIMPEYIETMPDIFENFPLNATAMVDYIPPNMHERVENMMPQDVSILVSMFRDLFENTELQD